MFSSFRRHDVGDQGSAERDGGGDPQPLQMGKPPEESRTRQFLAAEEGERRRLARRVHDEVGQLLAAIHMQLHLALDLDGQNAGSALAKSLEIVEQAMEQARDLSQDLYPALLDEIGLSAALRNDLHRRAERAGLTVNLLASSSWGQLPHEVDVTCFRVVREAVEHIVRHTSARQVQVAMRRDAEAVHLTIHGEGIGFAPEAVEPHVSQPPRQELSIRQRVELLGGTCRIRSARGQGTLIEVTIPLESPSH